MNARLLGLLALVLIADPARGVIVSLAPPPAPVAPPAAPDLGVVLPLPDPTPVPLADPPAAPVIAVAPPADVTTHPIAPTGPAALSIDPDPVTAPPPDVTAPPPDPNAVPAPLGVVGLMIAAGVFGVRRLMRRKATAE